MTSQNLKKRLNQFASFLRWFYAEDQLVSRSCNRWSGICSQTWSYWTPSPRTRWFRSVLPCRRASWLEKTAWHLEKIPSLWTAVPATSRLRWGTSNDQYYSVTHKSILISRLCLSGSGWLRSGGFHSFVSIWHTSPCPPSAHAAGSWQSVISESGAVPGTATNRTGWHPFSDISVQT